MSGTKYFSISFQFIPLDEPMLYDLFVNSSVREGREKFVRVFPIGQELHKEDIVKFEKKYHRLYVPEEQRSLYLKSLVKNEELEDEAKTEVIKDSAIQYLDKIFDPGTEFTTEVLNETIEGCKESVSSMVDVLQDKDILDIQKLIGNLSFHDFYTYDHSINVSMYCISIYRMYNPEATKDELIVAGLGGMLHDLGKLKVPTEIINFPGKLTDEMFDVIKTHPQEGKTLLENSGCSCEGVDLELVTRVVYEHHENFNGTGYPNKVEGVSIHVLARICAIADFFDAITTKRSYADVLSVDEALHVMSNAKGKKLDPELFDIFVKGAKTMIKEGKMNFELPEEFDPCQPQDEFPFSKIKKVEEKKDFGAIRVVDRMKPKKKSA